MGPTGPQGVKGEQGDKGDQVNNEKDFAVINQSVLFSAQ